MPGEEIKDLDKDPAIEEPPFLDMNSPHIGRNCW